MMTLIVKSLNAVDEVSDRSLLGNAQDSVCLSFTEWARSTSTCPEIRRPDFALNQRTISQQLKPA